MIPRKPSKGDPIDLSTRSQSSIIDAVDDLRQRQSAQYPGNIPRNTIPRGTVIKCVNLTDTVIPQYGAVELDGSRNDVTNADNLSQAKIIENMFMQQIFFALKLPTTWTFPYPDSDRKILGIAQRPININEVGDVLIDGVTQAYIHNASGRANWAIPQNGLTHLWTSEGYGPIEILWYPSSWAGPRTGYPLCLVRLSMAPQVIFLSAKAQEDWRETTYGYPAGIPVVDCLNCDADGSNVIGTYPGDEIVVHLPRDRIGYNAGADPAVYENDVIKYMYSPATSVSFGEVLPYCISDYLHMGKIKDIRIQGRDGYIPTGWHECDGSSQAGEAGIFNLHDFATTHAPVGTVEAVARMPRHKSANETQAEINEVWFFDAIGEASGSSPIKIPTTGDAIDSAGDHFNVQVGAYKTCTVMYIQRYK